MQEESCRGGRKQEMGKKRGRGGKVSGMKSCLRREKQKGKWKKSEEMLENCL